MKKVIRQIDRALKRLYHLDTLYRAEDFLVQRPVSVSAVGNAAFHGALYVQAEKSRELSLGIFLSEAVTQALSTFRRWPAARWTRDQIGAFTVATEEISHFNYLLHHARRERSISQLELELQGEIDKFLLAFFAQRPLTDQAEKLFDSLFEQLFYRFRLAEHLSAEQRDRYREANRLGRRFIRKHVRSLARDPHDERAFRLLRRFYRLSACEKISFLAA